MTMTETRRKTKNTYTVTLKDDTRFTVKAWTYSEASVRAARKLYRSRRVTAWRTTGVTAMSGWFQAYEPVGISPVGNMQWTSLGKPFHLSEEDR